MSADRPTTSPGEETPTSARLSRSIVETPKANQADFDDPSNWTPRFAEDYSVFNATPGNLRGPAGSSFPELPVLLSSESVIVDRTSDADLLSPVSTLTFPPVDPSRRLLSSPATAHPFPGPTAPRDPRESGQRSGKKARRGILAEPIPQTPTPPPSARKGGRRLAPKPQADSMHNDGFRSDFVVNAPQQRHHDIGDFANAPVDMFGMPLSTTTAAPGFEDAQALWDPGMGEMDLDFSIPVTNSFQNTGHRSMDSLEWGKTREIQESNPPQKKERLLAPKPTPAPVYSHSFHVQADDTFATLTPVGGVNPGLLLTRPPSSHMELAVFDPMAQPAVMNSLLVPQPTLVPAKEPRRGQVRRSASSREIGTMHKSSSRPGLLRRIMPSLPPAVRPGPSASISRSASQGSRTGGRTSPLKIHQRLSSLGSIPEHNGPRTRRARAETTVIVEDGDQATPSGSHRRQEERPQNWESSEDESSNSSFAVPEPRRPAYARPSHTSQRRFSEQSTSSLGIYYAEHGISHGDVEGEAETVINGPSSSQSQGDALSELRKVREDRQKRMPSLNHYQSSLEPSFGANDTMSSTSIGERTAPTPSKSRGNQIRCVCNTTLSQINGDGYMVQCESCEMWLHGRCVKITRQTLPRVYICAFCANTPNAHGNRGRGMRRGTGDSNHRNPATSPLAHKSLRSFRSSEFQITTHAMSTYNIVVFGGDHCGPEVVAEAVKTADAVLLGAIGGPKWGTGKVRPEQGILRLRKEMGTYGNLRPCFFPSESLVAYSPLKAEVCQGTDFTVPYSRAEIERIARLAGHLALARSPPAPVWSLDKANVLATSRLWRKVMTEVMTKEFPQLTLHHQLIDSAAMIMVKNPRGLNGVVVTSNLFGDIISDEASVIPGSIGLSPSASLSGIPDGVNPCNGIYEPIHGSAPDISGQGIVNPLGTILSVAMMCRYSLRLPKEADAIEQAVKNVLDGGVRTKDLHGNTTTKEMGDAVVAELSKLLKA
ncbi:hypothetical protein GGS20DRAFT_578163 [Poronia punctata]|nr:hypothetical protein GGS20DRAFT_578163 [Poronia punctata]